MVVAPVLSTDASWGPSDQGLLGWVGDPWPNGAQTAIPTAGTLTTCAMRLFNPVSVTNILMQCTTAGVTLTAGQCFAGIWAGFGGPLVGVTADQSGAWVSTGLKTMALAGGPLVVPAGIAIVGWWYNGTTGPKWKGGDTNAALNAGLAAAASRFGSANAGLTTTAPTPLGVMSAGTISCWAALN